MPVLVEIAPDHPCDRCGHPSKYHAGADRGSGCMVYNGRVWRGTKLPPKNGSCWCNGYFPAP